jgi:anaerobic selenocysteine-containing dehydrogenase
VLIGRRHLRSNNSWMHNLASLTGGSNRCTMLIHPDDAARLGVKDGAPARIASAAGELDVIAEISDAIAPGVVSIPHGWSEVGDGVRASVQAVASVGVNSNVLAPTSLIDPLSGNAVLNGIPVTVSA